jgi:hypothetical protein
VTLTDPDLLLIAPAPPLTAPGTSRERFRSREVDFVVAEGKRPRLLVECKWTDAEVDRSLRYLKARCPDAHAWQVSAVGTKDYQTLDGIRVAPALKLLDHLI